jgi:hypothetical protein
MAGPRRAAAGVALFVALSFAGWRAGATSSSATWRRLSAGGSDTKPAHPCVLFIGNSLTYFNEMPWMTEEVAKSLGKPLRAIFAGASGRNLRQQWEDPKVLQMMRDSHADFVVLQPQSAEVMRDFDSVRRYARLLATEARKSGAKPVFFMTWAVEGMSQQEITKRSILLARELRAPIAPVGLAWEHLQKRGINLFWDDVHPNVAGSYLEACIFYAMVNGESPAGATHIFDLKFAIPEFYRRSLETERIDDATAEEIQRVAWAAVRAASK